MDSTPILRKNKHLNASECYKLEVLLKAKMKVSEIAHESIRNSTDIRETYKHDI